MTAHFNPGDALYYKTGIGNQFAVGRILEIEDGQLKVGSSEEEMRSFTVTSPDIMPLSILNNDFSIIVNKGMISFSGYSLCYKIDSLLFVFWNLLLLSDI